MTKKQTQTIEGKIFQWSVITFGGGLWLYHLYQLTINWQMLAAQGDTGGMVKMLALMLTVLAVSLKPVYLTTPGMIFSHKRQLSLSLSDAMSFLLLVLYGITPAIVASGLDGLVASYRTVKRLESNLFSLAMFAISFWLAGHAYQKLLPLEPSPPTVSMLVMPLLVAASVHFLNASWLLSIILGLRYRTSIWRQWVDNQLWTAATYLFLPVATLVVYYFWLKFNWMALLGLGPSLMLLYLSYSQYNQKVEEKMHKIQEMNELHLSVVQALTMAIDAKDNTSCEHVARVKIYGFGLARLLGLSEQETQAIEAGAMLHDVGKLGVPDYIINKPGRLSDAEFEKMKSHTVIGAEILSQVKFPYPLVPVVRSHHERWDGSGYPDGLRGNAIPLTAQILAISDCFDMLCEDRQYRKGMSRDQAISILREESGTHFNPELVTLFLEHLPAFEKEIIERGLSLEQVSAQTRAVATKRAEKQAAPLQPHEKIKEAHREILLLYELSQAVGSSLSLRDTLVVLLGRIADLVPFTTSAVLLKDREREELYVAHASGQDAEALRGRWMTLETGISSWVYVNQTPSFNSDPMLDFDVLQAPVLGRYQTSLVVPLSKNDEVFGALALYTTDFPQYSKEHTRLVESIAHLAGDAVTNALRHEEMEATALTDRLTGFPNLRAILARFEEESSRAHRQATGFTLLMMDLDGFKAINDTLGHQMGDRYLTEIAKTINAQMRDYDFFGRYAGDEFIALLSHTHSTDTVQMAERIRQAVSNFALIGENGMTARAGVSVGAAEYGLDGHSLEELMAAADKAMYADKVAKPNRTPRASGGPHKLIKVPAKSSLPPIQAAM